MPAVRKNKIKKSKKVDVEEISMPVVSGQLDKKLKKQDLRRQRKIENERGIVFIRNLPHGFFEKQLKNYFAQFGNVTNVRLSRSTRTGGSRGFAFVEFQIPEVAQVAAETMNNYLMFKKLTKASYIPPNEQRYNYFKTTVKQIKNKVGKVKYVSNLTKGIQRKVREHNNWSEKAYQKRTAAGLKRLKKLNAKYAHLGIDFNEILMGPNIIKAENNISDESSSLSHVNTSKDKKEKTLVETVNEVQRKQEKSKQKKKEKDGNRSEQDLLNLLGTSLTESGESGDEEYLPMEETNYIDDSEESSEEEIASDAEDDDNEEDDSDENDSDEDNENSVYGVEVDDEIYVGKKEKRSNVERLEQLIKRKRNTGGVQKLNNKSNKKAQTVTGKSKKSLQLAEAKLLAKPLKALRPKGLKNIKKKTVNAKK